ncbi:MAG: hypothetical protein COW63_15585 [Bacteroidetes bacterium CG18_big_fil_WC_8_21_14_2_50_41_14]|nr:MAG: hypothetical protein COW63_15585 [Bacteroidetes bacterium CG18_big_fil_WC_8_21_14_2_50_41_14]
MKIEDILIKEDNQNIHLHKEGLFWRAYEYSAFAFVKEIKKYNAKKKFIKKVNSEIVFIGFPESTLGNILDLCKQKGYAVNKNEHLITIKLITKSEGFEIWKDEIEIEDKNHVTKDDDSLSERIAGFPLATKTPMEAQQFLYNLQMEINGNL